MGRLGGLPAQLNALAVLRNLSISENAGIAIANDISPIKFLAQLARRRRTDVDYAKLLGGETMGIKKKVYAQLSSTKPNVEEKEMEQKGGKEGNGEKTVPKKTFSSYKPRQMTTQRNRRPWNPRFSRRDDRSRMRNNSRKLPLSPSRKRSQRNRPDRDRRSKSQKKGKNAKAPQKQGGGKWPA